MKPAGERRSRREGGESPLGWWTAVCSWSCMNSPTAGGWTKQACLQLRHVKGGSTRGGAASYFRRRRHCIGDSGQLVVTFKSLLQRSLLRLFARYFPSRSASRFYDTDAEGGSHISGIACNVGMTFAPATTGALSAGRVFRSNGTLGHLRTKTLPPSRRRLSINRIRDSIV